MLFSQVGLNMAKRPNYYASPSKKHEKSPQLPPKAPEITLAKPQPSKEPTSTTADPKTAPPLSLNKHKMLVDENGRVIDLNDVLGASFVIHMENPSEVHLALKNPSFSAEMYTATLFHCVVIAFIGFLLLLMA